MPRIDRPLLSQQSSDLYWSSKVVAEIIKREIRDPDLLDASKKAEILKAANASDNPLAAKTLDRMIERARQSENGNVMSIAWDVRDALKNASEGAKHAQDGRAISADVYGLEFAQNYDSWRGAQWLLRQHEGTLKNCGLDDLVDPAEARRVVGELAPKMQAFFDLHGSMLRGERAVSDVYPKAFIFEVFPALKNKDLPAFLDTLAEEIARAPESLLTGLFHKRWLVPEYYRPFEGLEKKLIGNLDGFTMLLRSDAEYLRKGYPIAKKTGWSSGLDLRQYSRADNDNHDCGVIPDFLTQLGIAATLHRGEDAEIPTYNDRTVRTTITVQKGEDGTTQIIVGGKTQEAGDPA